MSIRDLAAELTVSIAVLLISLLTFASTAQAAAPANEWWDSNYSLREKITLSAGSSTVPSGYSVSVTFDHASLVSSGKSQASGDDIRIAFWNGSGWTELDRVLDEGSSWDNGSTQVWFKTQAQINANNSDDNYYLYYNNTGATNPPATKSNVYVFYDDFESGDLSNWTVQVDAVWSAASDQVHSGNYSLKASGFTTGEDKWITANGINESDLLMEAYWRFNDVSGLDVSQGFRSSSSLPINHYETNLEGTDGWNISKMITNWSEIEPNPTGQNPQNNVWTKITTIIEGTNMQVLRNDTQLVPSSGWTDVGSELSSGTVGFRVWDIGSGDAWWIDDVKARKYVSPEPTNLMGIEEEYNNTFSYSYRKQIEIDRSKIANPALLPIAFDSVSSAETLPAAGATSLTWSHTVGSGQDPILLVGVSIRNDSNQEVSSVTCNGTPLTRKGFVTNGMDVRAELWYLPGASFPAPGTYDVVVNMSATARFVAGAFSMFNVDPTTPLGAFASNSGTGDPTWGAAVDVASTKDEVVVATLAKQYDDPVAPQQMAHQADRWNLTTHDVSANNVLGVGTLRGAAGSTTTPMWFLGDDKWPAVGGRWRVRQAHYRGCSPDHHPEGLPAAL